MANPTLPVPPQAPGFTEQKRVQLLISVRSVAEAQLAMNHHVDWIDLKDPTNGPLGAPRTAVANAVADALTDHPRRSVAMGELSHLDDGLAMALAKRFPVVKVGLSYLKPQPDWPQRLDRMAAVVNSQGATLVPVIYADWQFCNAPPPRDVAEYAQAAGSDYLLIDTFSKRGQHLLQWMSPDELLALAEHLGSSQTQLVVAGSVTETEVSTLLDLPISAVGVRGAVCDGTRTADLCPQKVASWVARFHSQ